MFEAKGRGRGYSPRRGLVETVLRAAYVRDWPGRLWGTLPMSKRVDLIAFDLPVLPAFMPSLRVAFMSDLHIGPTTASVTLDHAFERVRSAAPDVLLLGGDYVFLEATAQRTAELEARVAQIQAHLKIAVFGNHDLWTHHDRIEAALVRAGCKVLINDCVALPPPHDGVAIVGIDDPWTGSPDVPRALAAVANAKVVLALAHAPEAAPMLAGDRRVVLLLCGHTHGGHIALPGERPVVVPGPVGQKYPWGRHEIAGVATFVSRGVGGIELPMRTFAPPDVVIVTLCSSA